MSLYSDYLNDYMYELEHPIGYPEQKIWVTKDNGHIKVSDMSIKHIMNCLRLIKDNLINEVWVSIFNEDLERRNCR